MSPEGDHRDTPSAGADTPNYRYEEVNRKYYIKQLAYTPVEGIGVNGSYFLRGFILSRNGSLFVSAMGKTGASHLGTARFFGSIEVLKGDNVIARAGLERRGAAVWPDDGFLPIGSARIQLPSPQDATSLGLKITGGYIFTNASGAAAPLPPRTSETYDLPVVRNETR